ncbi:MAG: multicopper oxidase domain-containing protein [Patescibacteria group bacterium]
MEQQSNGTNSIRTVLVYSIIGLFAAMVFGIFWFFFLSSGDTPVGLGWYLFSFAAGLTMIVLPCTLPLAFVIVPLSMGKGVAKGVGMALAFGIGVALTLSLYGIIAALIGEVAIGTLGAPLEVVKNWLYFVAGIFAFLFALSEIGLLNFHMPTYSGAAPAFIQKQGDVFKALLLGLFMGNIGVGCPHPATPMILTRIAASGDVFYGWTLFLVHAIGRILPLLLLAFLAILGVNALSWLVKRKDKIERATGWGMVFVAAFILVLGLFTHDWWVNSGQHTLLEEITQEEYFLGAVIDQFNLKEAPHGHGLEDGPGLFGLPLWLGNWILVILWIIPLWWYYWKRKVVANALPDGEEKKCEEKLTRNRFLSFVVLTILFVVVFVYFLPQRFLWQQQSSHAMTENGEMNGGHGHDGANGHANEPSGTMSEQAHSAMPDVSALLSLPLRTPKDRIATLPFVMKDGAKEFRLDAQEFRWEYAEGKWVHVWGYNGQIPGPEIRVNEGEKVRVIVKNSLPSGNGTSVHWHGVDVEWEADGVPGVTQLAILPGEEYVYEFTAKPAGTKMYHTHGSTHMTAAQQLDMGLSGAFIIEPKKPAYSYEREYTFVLDEWDINGGINSAVTHVHGAGEQGVIPNFNTFTINGRTFPFTDILPVKKGEKVLIRMINAGTAEFHPMHLHGHQFSVVARDGNAIRPENRETRNTLTVLPGETADIIFSAENPGVWLFHCHHIHHASAGMVSVFAYEGSSPILSIEEIVKIESSPSMGAMSTMSHGDSTTESESMPMNTRRVIETAGDGHTDHTHGEDAVQKTPPFQLGGWWTNLFVSLFLTALLGFGVNRYLNPKKQ